MENNNTEKNVNKKNNNKQTIILVVAIIAIAVILYMLMGGGNTKKLAKKLLEEKFGEEFEVVESYGRVIDYNEVVAYSLNYPDIFFEAKVYKEDNSISDEYVTSRVCRKIEEKIEQNIVNLPGKIFVRVAAISNSIDSSNSNMSIDEYLTLKSKNQYVVYLHYVPTKKDAIKTYQELKNILNGLEKMKGRIQLYIVDDALLNKVENHLSKLPKIDEEYKDMLEHINRISIPFENGILDMTQEQFVKEANGRV